MVRRKLFESSISSVYPSADDLLEFVRSQISILENVGESRKLFRQDKSNKSIRQQLHSSNVQPKKLYLAAMVMSKSINFENNICWYDIIVDNDIESL